MAKKSLRVEALLAAAAPAPPPFLDHVLDPARLGGAWPDDLPALLRLLPQADLDLQDEGEVARHPTLTRVWCRRGRLGQRKVQAPGTNAKRYGFGLVDWPTGWLDWELAEGRRAAPVCAQVRRAVARSRARGRVALIILDNLSIHPPAGSRLVRALLAERGDWVRFVDTPAYDPDSNRIEWLWRALRRAVTHTHQRTTLDELLSDAAAWVHDLTPGQILRQIGSPYTDARPPDPLSAPHPLIRAA